MRATVKLRQAIERIRFWMQPFGGNEFYGIGRIVREYTGLSPWHPLTKARIQHGFEPFLAYSDAGAMREALAFYISERPDCRFLMFSSVHAQHLSSLGISQVEAIGAPIIYMDEYLKSYWKKRKAGTTRGTIAFPSKSTHHVKVEFDVSRYAEMLAELPEKFHPVRVCLYYLDVDLPQNGPYRDRGIEVVSNGSLYDQQFLQNFFDNCADCEFATCNDPLSSATFYSMFAGLKFFESYVPISAKSATGMHEQYAREKQYGRQLMPHCFPIDDVENVAYQRDTANQELGVHSKKSPEDLRCLICEDAGLTREYCHYLAKSVKQRVRRTIKRT